jgi:regulator of protease activity HflC (stomatin/prohibitin superfamily)
MKQLSWKFLVGVVALVLVGLMFKPWVIVPAGHCAVLYNRAGGGLRQVSEGMSWKTPVLETVEEVYDVRTRTYTMSATSWEGEVQGDDSLAVQTADGQRVNLDISVRFHPDRGKVAEIHQATGRDYIDKLIRPAIISITPNVVADYKVTAVYSSARQEIENELEKRLKARLEAGHIRVDEVLLRDVRFSAEFEQAIQEKQIAEQEAERMTYVLQKAEKEKQQKIIEAEGEAKSIRLKGQAIAANAKVVQYEYLRKVAPNVKVIITDGKTLDVPLSRSLSASPSAP